jgi:hypothetical protein
MNKEAPMLEGKKTYIIAALMVVHSIAAYFLGTPAPLDIQEILAALGLAALRNGVK